MAQKRPVNPMKEYRKRNAKEQMMRRRSDMSYQNPGAPASKWKNVLIVIGVIILFLLFYIAVQFVGA